MFRKILSNKKGIDPDLVDSLIGVIIVLAVFLVFFILIRFGLGLAAEEEIKRNEIDLMREHLSLHYLKTPMTYSEYTIAEYLGLQSKSVLDQANSHISEEFVPGICYSEEWRDPEDRGRPETENNDQVLIRIEESKTGLLTDETRLILGTLNIWDLKIYRYGQAHFCEISHGYIGQYERDAEGRIKIPSNVLIPSMDPEIMLEVVLRMEYKR